MSTKLPKRMTPDKDGILGESYRGRITRDEVASISRQLGVSHKKWNGYWNDGPYLYLWYSDTSGII